MRSRIDQTLSLLLGQVRTAAHPILSSIALPRTSVMQHITTMLSITNAVVHISHDHNVSAEWHEQNTPSVSFHSPVSHLPATASTLSQLTLLPSPLLALVACHLPPAALLQLQRCSSTLHNLRADDAYMMQAWRYAELRLSLTERLHEWTLPLHLCIGDFDSSGQYLIPVAVWQAALPVYQEVLNRTDKFDECHQRLRELVRQGQPQRTKWVRARLVNVNSWRTVYGSAAMSNDVQRVEVLADLHRDYMGEQVLPQFREVEVRCRVVLQACPHLQHLDLAMDEMKYEQPSHADTFALLPALRSLHLTQMYSSDPKQLLIDDPPIDFESMLDSLPHLTSLQCVNVDLGVDDLLDTASHSTLETLDIDTAHQMADLQWIGRCIFPISADEDNMQLVQDQSLVAFDGDIDEESEELLEARIDHLDEQLSYNESEETEPEWARQEMQRLHAALTRTQPTQRSCEMRLALADWLHRRLRRGGLRTDDHSSDPAHPKWLLRSCRRQVALVRSTLRQQLSELISSAATAVGESALRVENNSEADQLEQLLQQCRHALTQRETDLDDISLQLSHQCSRLSQRRKQLAETGTQHGELQRSIAASKTASLEAEIAAQRQREQTLQMETRWLTERVEHLQEVVRVQRDQSRTDKLTETPRE